MDLRKPVQATSPDGVQDHVEGIVHLRLVVPDEVWAHLAQPRLHAAVAPLRYRTQNVAQPRNVTLGNGDRESIPGENVAEGQDEIVSDDDGHAVVVDGFDNARTVHLVPRRADAELARLHVLLVRGDSGNFLGQHLVDLHVGMLVFPMLQQHRSHTPVHLPREERQERALVPPRPA